MFATWRSLPVRYPSGCVWLVSTLLVAFAVTRCCAASADTEHFDHILSSISALRLGQKHGDAKITGDPLIWSSSVPSSDRSLFHDGRQVDWCITVEETGMCTTTTTTAATVRGKTSRGTTKTSWVTTSVTTTGQQTTAAALVISTTGRTTRSFPTTSATNAAITARTTMTSAVTTSQERRMEELVMTAATAPCKLGASFPVTGCDTIVNGGYCEAHTEVHKCMEQGILGFECPDLLSGRGHKSWVRNLSIETSGGLNASFSLWSSSPSGRMPNLVNTSGSFGVKCKVCGLAISPPQDEDIREGYLRTVIEFGPNILNGLVDETGISGYSIYLVNNCHEKLSARLAHVNITNHTYTGLAVPDPCSCPSSTYRVEVATQLPPGQSERAQVRLMVVPLTLTGYDLPMGVSTGALQDHFTSTISTAIRTKAARAQLSTGTIHSRRTEATASNSLWENNGDENTTLTSTSTTTPVVAALVRGSFDLDFNDAAAAAAFIQDSKARGAVSESISNLTGVPTYNVEVTLALISRRLAISSNETLDRTSNASKVKVGYVITLVEKAAAPTATAVSAALSATGEEELTKLLEENLVQKVGPGVYQVKVVGFSTPIVERLRHVQIQEAKEGKPAIVPVAVTLMFLFYGSGGCFLWIRSRRRQEEKVQPVEPVDLADFVDEDPKLRIDDDALRAIAKADSPTEA